jgi:hypothetical protein
MPITYFLTIKMRKLPGIFVLLPLMNVALIASAQQPKPIPAFPPDSFQLSGSWNCEGSFRGGKFHRAKFTGATILANKWLELTEQDVEPATGYVAKYLIGYDPQQNRLVEFDANNFGAATYSSETGWQNHVLAMTSPVSQDAKGTYAANQFLYTVVGKDEFDVDWQISKTAAISWIVADHLACKRSGA